mgnify:CR=1 FL=1
MDILVLGGGPAGATAAIYAARAGKAVTLVYQDGGALARAEKIENFYGFPAPIHGPALFERGLEQAEALGVTVLRAQVLGLGLVRRVWKRRRPMGRCLQRRLFGNRYPEKTAWDCRPGCL